MNTGKALMLTCNYSLYKKEEPSSSLEFINQLRTSLYINQRRHSPLALASTK